MMSLRCDLCPEPAFAVAPGSVEVRELFLLQRAIPMRCWCLAHWLIAHQAERAA